MQPHTPHPTNEEVDIYEIPKGGPYEGTKVDAIAVDKPVVIYFNGLQYFNDLNLPERKMLGMNKYIADLFFHAELPESDHRLYTIRRCTPTTDIHELKKLSKHNKNPEYTDNESRSIVHKIFSPFVRDLNRSTDKEADLHATEQAMSKILLVGHSLGASYMQRTRNALIEELKDKGYDQSQQERVMQSLAGLALSTPYNIKDRGKTDLPTLHMVVENDSTAERWGDSNSAEVRADTDPHLRSMRRGTHLFMQPVRIPGELKVMRAKLVPLEDGLDITAPSSTINHANGNGEHHRQWAIEVTTSIDPTRHDSRLTTNTTRFFTPTILNLQSSAGADVAEAFIHSALEASQHAIATDTPRNTLAILDGLQKTHLSTEAKGRSGQRAANAEQHFRELVNFSSQPANSAAR